MIRRLLTITLAVLLVLGMMPAIALADGDTYKVIYNGNGNDGGTAPTDSYSPYTSESHEVTVLDKGDLALTGYTFVGWDTQSGGNGTHYDAGNKFTISEDTTLYAQWAKNYTVKYDGNGSKGGNVPEDANKYLEGGTVIVLGNTEGLVKEDCTFKGWNTQGDGLGTPYAGGATFSMGTENVTLYAQWAQNFTVTYNGNEATGGSVPVDSSVYNKGDTATVLDNTGTLVKTGYRFGGWNTEQGGGGTPYAAGASISIDDASVTLYAQWVTDAAEPVITGQPSGGFANIGVDITLSVTATGTGELSYQWYSNASNSNTGGTKLDGKTEASITITPGDLGTIYYYCEVTNTDSLATGNQKAVKASSAAEVIVTEYSAKDITKIQDFLNQNSYYPDKKNYKQLGYDPNDPGTWDEVKWTVHGGIKYAEEIKWNNCRLAGSLDLRGCDYLKSLICHYNYITGLDVRDIVSLEYLDCAAEGGYMDVLDLKVSGDTGLTELDCSSNGFETLTLSGLSSLKTLDCSNNALTGLDLSGLGKLRTLICCYNGIESLTLTGLDSLYYLDCSDNLIAGLTISDLSSLNYIDCSGNGLSSLSLVRLGSLEELYCYNNNLDSSTGGLSVDGLTALKYLDCSGNQMLTRVTGLSGLTGLKSLIIDWDDFTGTLDATPFTQLNSLSFSGNEIDEVKVNDLAKLEYLDCSDNSLDSLDLTGLAALKYLDCSGNGDLSSLTGLNYLTTLQELNIHFTGISGNLDLTKFTQLDELDCSECGLRSLLITNLAKLVYLDCSYNNLKTLDLTGCSKLEYIDCSDNSLSSLDLGNTPDLQMLSTSDNTLTEIKAQINGGKIRLVSGGTGKGYVVLQMEPYYDDGEGDYDSTYLYANVIPDNNTVFVNWTDNSKNNAEFSTDPGIDLNSGKDYDLTANFAHQMPSAYLSNLTVETMSGASLSPAFSKSTYKYSLKMDEHDDYVSLTAIPENAFADVTINGSPMDYMTPAIIEVANGAPPVTVTIIVRYNYMLTKTYKITITRPKSKDCDLRSLDCDYGDFGFDSGLRDYNFTVSENTTAVTFTAETNSPLAKVTPASKTLKFKNPGDKQTAKFKVKAQAGNTKTYTVTVTRAPSTNSDIKSIKLSSSKAVLSPPFDPEDVKDSYTITMDASLGSVKITVKPAGYGATVLFGTKKTTSYTVKLAKGGEAWIYIYVTAQAGGTPKQYTIHVTRNSS